MTNSESKYFNTSKKMQEALFELLNEKNFEFITIKDICKRARVNRSTFYLHYENLYSLLNETIRGMNETLISYFPVETEEVLKNIHQKNTEKLNFMNDKYLIPYLKFIKDNQKMFQAVLKNPCTFDQQSAFDDMSRYVLIPILSCFYVPEKEQKYVLAYFINGLIAVVKEWIKDGCNDDIQFISSVMAKYIPSGKST